CGRRVCQPGDFRIENTELVDKEIVDDAEDIVVHPRPHLSRDDRRDGPRNQHRRPHHPTASEVRMYRESDDHTEERLEADREDREDGGLPERAPEQIVIEEILVVQEPQPAWFLQTAEPRVGETEAERPVQGIKGDNCDDEEARKYQRPGEPLATACGLPVRSTPPPFRLT